MWRSRWAAIGAAIAVSLGAGGVFVSHAAPGPDESTIVMVTPDRILDSRDPTDLGLPGPFASTVSQKLQVTGAVPTSTGTKTVVPTGATGVLLNVTAVQTSASGFISIRPGDAAGPPSTSSLNIQAGVTIPNAVQVALPTSGANAGQIDITYDSGGAPGPITDILIDVVGYTTNTGLQELVADVAGGGGGGGGGDLQQQIDDNATDIATNAADIVDLQSQDTSLQDQINSNDVDISNLQNQDVNLQSQINANGSDIDDLRSDVEAAQVKTASLAESAFTPRQANEEMEAGFSQGGAYLATIVGSEGGLIAPISIPDGARITRFSAHSWDDTNAGGANLTIRLQRINFASGSYTNVATVSTFAGGGVVEDFTFLSHTVNNTVGAYQIFVTGAVDIDRRIRAVEITYEVSAI